MRDNLAAFFRHLPVWALGIATSAGFAGWALRSAAGAPHAVLVGCGVFGIVLAVCLAVIAVNRAFSE